MSAPNLKEVEWAISELEKEESSFSVYDKLASLYTVRNELLGIQAVQQQVAGYSETAPTQEPLGLYGDSDFLQTVTGKDPESAWVVMDELMETLKVVNRRTYDSVMRKLEKL